MKLYEVWLFYKSHFPTRMNLSPGLFPFGMYIPVVGATQEAEAEGVPELGWPQYSEELTWKSDWA
jgi:hypothetical protein